jgi:hypothetical protein
MRLRHVLRTAYCVLYITAYCLQTACCALRTGAPCGAERAARVNTQYAVRSQ